MSPMVTVSGNNKYKHLNTTALSDNNSDPLMYGLSL